MDEEIEVQSGLGHMASNWQSWDQTPGLLGCRSVFLKYYSCSKTEVTLDLPVPLRANV